MKEFWDTRYAEIDFAYGKTPNAFFKEIIDKLSPGKILLPADGEGRNAVYAASKGWDVTAVDMSESGKCKALDLAKEIGVTILYEVTNLLDFHPQEQYDVIGLIYAHFPAEIRQVLHHKFIDALKPGGKLILEGFRPDQLNYHSGGPKAIEMLYPLSMIQEDFKGLKVEMAEEQNIQLNEGRYHQGEAAVTRFIAVKPEL